MKAITASSILRAARARFEMWGIVQLGPQEFLAIEFAYKETGNEQLRFVIHNGLFAIQRLNPVMFQAIREGYKALENLDKDTEFVLPSAEEKKEEQTIPDWMKELDKSMEKFDPKDFIDDDDKSS